MTHNQAAPGGGRVEWYHPGEVVIVARVRRGELDQAQVHATLRERLGSEIPADPATLRTFTFNAPGEPLSLVFMVQKLANDNSARSVKTAVDALHSQLATIGTADVEVLAAMPHVHTKAHESYFGGSPGSDPVPLAAARGAYRDYLPAIGALRARTAADAMPVHVAVLDTQWNLDVARRQAERFAVNRQLADTIEALSGSMQHLDSFEQEWKEVGYYHGEGGARAAAERGGYHMPDHGLFVAGLIHSMAPHAALSYQPVLDDLGVGDLSLLLIGLKRVLDNKPEDALQIINLSLGFIPHPARLPAAWYGLPRPNDAQYVYSDALFEQNRNARWVSTNREHVDTTVDLLQKGLRELARYLRLNNCLVVAAVGNDSLDEVEAGQMRMQPRLPARFQSVLGVAATTGNPDRPAPYSNLGEESELGDHVATFGGSITSHSQPEDGVIGIYAGDFPNGKKNETGWAYWSGTSFATGIVSGVAANVWANSPELSAADVLAELHATAQAGGHYVRELRAPSIAVEGRWR